jgi:hypothetical protein
VGGRAEKGLFREGDICAMAASKAKEEARDADEFIV